MVAVDYCDNRQQSWAPVLLPHAEGGGGAGKRDWRWMDLDLARSAFELGVEQMRELASAAFGSASRWIAHGYDKAPLLIAGLALAAMVPALAILGVVVKLFAARQPPVPEPEVLRTELAVARGLGWPCTAWLSVEGERQSRRPMPGELFSIGREDDNDLRLEHATVHRHHAVVHRDGEARFLIQDLSGSGGNGVRINGARVASAALCDGDRIEIGAVALRFEAQPA